jgi:two-component system, cell cycle sensor histidine kinase and response regulator CckA
MNPEDMPDFDMLEDSRPIPKRVSTETIDVNVLIDELSTSGSFDLKGISATSFGRLLQALPVPTLLIDESGSLGYANESWERISKSYTRMLGQPFASLFVNSEVSKEAKGLIEKVFTTRKPQVAMAVLKIDKNRIFARMHFRCIRFGVERSIICLVQDLTVERRQLELIKKHREDLLKAHAELEKRVEERTAELTKMNRKLLREIAERKRAQDAFGVSEEKYRVVVENAQEGICVVQDGRIKFLNRAGEKLLGRSLEELLSRPFTDFVHPDDVDMMATRERRNLTVKGNPEVFSVRVSDKEGAVKTLEVNSVLIEWEDRTATLQFLNDITSKIKMEEEQRRIANLESIGVLAGGIAHDFNNILTVVLGNVTLARLLVGSDNKAYERLGDVEMACTRAKNLTNQLLTFSRGGAPVKKTSNIVKVIRDSCKFALGGSKVRCDCKFSEDLWPVDIDEGQIGQVFHNIIINADQAMPQGGIVQVEGENVVVTADGGLSLQPGRYVRVSTRDEGIGILEDHLPKVFDPYFSTKQKGSGLGLATSHSIIKNHGGLITVESQVGVGTTFDTYLPASENQAGTDPGQISIPTVEWKRVLVMDDEEPIRGLARELLRPLGYEVTLAGDGSEAIDLVARAIEAAKPFDCVILDLTVPGGMGGQEAARILREKYPEIRILVSSGYSNDPVLADYERYGFDGVVAKPYGMKELHEAVSRAVGIKSPNG